MQDSQFITKKIVKLQQKRGEVIEKAEVQQGKLVIGLDVNSEDEEENIKY